MTRKKKEHLCKTCGETDPNKFRTFRKEACRACENKKSLEYQKDNKETLREYNKKYLENYRKDNLENLKEYHKNYYQANKEKNREDRKAYMKTYRRNNADSVREYHKKYSREKKQKDPGFKYMSDLRVRQNRVLKGVISTTEGLGCNTQELKDHLESLFTEGMTHENHGKGPGKWNIDHIDPISLHDKDENGEWCTKSERNKKLMHYTNMQPLWEEDNLKKSNKVLDLY